MTTDITAIGIASNAFNMIGMPRISSFEAEEGEEAVTAGALFNTAAKETLARRRWTFASTEVEIHIDDTKEPLSGYTAVLTKPSDVLTVWKVQVNARPIDYRLSVDGVNANVDANTEVWMDYTYYVGPEAWTYPFAAIVEADLTMRFAAIFAEKDSLANFYRQIRDLNYRVAATLDSMQHTTQTVFGRRGRRVSGSRRI